MCTRVSAGGGREKSGHGGGGTGVGVGVVPGPRVGVGDGLGEGLGVMSTTWKVMLSTTLMLPAGSVARTEMVCRPTSGSTRVRWTLMSSEYGVQTELKSR